MAIKEKLKKLPIKKIKIKIKLTFLRRLESKVNSTVRKQLKNVREYYRSRNKILVLWRKVLISHSKQNQINKQKERKKN